MNRRMRQRAEGLKRASLRSADAVGTMNRPLRRASPPCAVSPNYFVHLHERSLASGHWDYKSAPLPAHQLFVVLLGMDSGLVSGGFSPVSSDEVSSFLTAQGK